MENEEQKKEYFRAQCERYLTRFGISDLRAYGRHLGLAAPTKCNKTQLINEILLVLCGGKRFMRNNRGAPIKNNYFDDDIPIKIQQIKQAVFFGDELSMQSREESCVANVIDEQASTQIQFNVSLEKLSEEQKQLLFSFLNSL